MIPNDAKLRGTRERTAFFSRLVTNLTGIEKMHAEVIDFLAAIPVSPYLLKPPERGGSCNSRPQFFRLTVPAKGNEGQGLHSGIVSYRLLDPDTCGSRGALISISLSKEEENKQRHVISVCFKAEP